MAQVRLRRARSPSADAQHGRRALRARGQLHPRGRLETALPGAPHLLRGPQLRGARASRWAPIPTREPPFFFQKPTDAIQLVPDGATIDHPYPTITKNYHYEVELVAALGKRRARYPGGRGARLRVRLRGRPRHDAPRPAARRWATRRSRGKSASPSIMRRWSATCIRRRSSAIRRKGAIWLKVNGQTKQSSDLSNMIWNVAEQVSQSVEATTSSSPATSSTAARRRTSGRSSRAT